MASNSPVNDISSEGSYPYSVSIDMASSNWKWISFSRFTRARFLLFRTSLISSVLEILSTFVLLFIFMILNIPFLERPLREASRLIFAALHTFGQSRVTRSF